METETVDSYPRNPNAYKSILAYHEEGAQSGAYYNDYEEDLFATTIEYDYYNNTFRPLNLGCQDYTDLSPINLGPSFFGMYRNSGKDVFGEQRSLLATHNLLRPSSITNNQFRPTSINNDNAFESENGKNLQSAPADERVLTNLGHAYTATPGKSHGELGGECWTQNTAFTMTGGLSGPSRNPNEVLCQDWIHDGETNTVGMLVGKAVNTADHVHKPARPENGLSTMRGDHLDGPVLPSISTEEAHAGQMADCYNASIEFECDGNSYISFTDDSME